MPIFLLAWFKGAIPYLVGLALIIGVEAWFYNWSFDRGFQKEKVVYDKFVAEERVVGAKAKADAEALDKQHEADAQATSEDYGRATVALNQYWSDRLRRAAGAGGSSVSKAPNNPTVIDAGTADPLVTPAVAASPEVIKLEYQCADTTQQLESLQSLLHLDGVIVGQ